MKKRLIAILLTTVMLVSVILPMTVSADYEEYFTIDNLNLSTEIADSMREFKPQFTFSTPIPYEQFEWIMCMVTYTNLDVRCVWDGTYTYWYDTDAYGRKMVSKVEFEYTGNKQTLAEIKTAVRSWLDSVIALADPTFTDLEYAIFFHDYLAAHYEYDLTYSDSAYDIFGFIKNDKGVCQAYTSAYMLLMNNVGVDSVWAVSHDMNHSWAQVEIDGQWYNVDVTWDDPENNRYGAVDHEFFLKSDTAFKTMKPNHYKWGTFAKCTSTKYDNAFFNGIDSSFVYADGMWYYLYDGDLYKTDSPDKAGTRVRDFDYEWLVWDDHSMKWNGQFSTLMGYRNKVYISTPNSVYSYNTADNSIREVYNYSGDEGYIYGMRINLGGGSSVGFGGYDAVIDIRKHPDYVGTSKKTTLAFRFYPGYSGNANADGSVNLTDVSLMMKYIAGWDIKVPDKNACDFDGNGKVNLTDVSYTMKYVAGWYN